MTQVQELAPESGPEQSDELADRPITIPIGTRVVAMVNGSGEEATVIEITETGCFVETDNELPAHSGHIVGVPWGHIAVHAMQPAPMHSASRTRTITIGSGSKVFADAGGHFQKCTIDTVRDDGCWVSVDRFEGLNIINSEFVPWLNIWVPADPPSEALGSVQ